MEKIDSQNNKQEPVVTPVTQALEGNRIPYRVFTHPGAVFSLEQAARERGQKPEQVIRSIVFRVSEGNYAMVLVAGPRQISWPRLREHLQVKRMSMASPEEVLKHTGYPIGAVSPFGLPEPMRLLADENVFTEDEVSIGSGVRYTTVILHSQDLRRALGAVEIGQFLE